MPCESGDAEIVADQGRDMAAKKKAGDAPQLEGEKGALWGIAAIGWIAPSVWSEDMGDKSVERHG